MLQFLYQIKVQFIVVISLSLLLYANTLTHGYALDDKIVIHQNLNVQAGIAGIPKILSTDAFQGYLDMAGAQSPIKGGRFRPLSIVTFAIEQSLFGLTLGLDYRQIQVELADLESNGSDPTAINAKVKVLQSIKDKMEKSTEALAFIRHTIQLFLFTLSMCVLLLFLYQHVFPQQSLLALLTVVLFILHPVHTEVVANIKSRDEILSLLFITLSLHYSFEWLKNKTRKNLIYLSISLGLALLSKEYAMLLPIVIAIAWYSLLQYDAKAIWNKAFKTIVFVTLGFIIIRFFAFSNLHSKSKITDVLNDPYLYASTQEAIASKCALILEYMRLFFYPRHLSADYSYSHFSYITFTHWRFILALLLYATLVYCFWIGIKKQKTWLFPLSIFLGFFFLVNNLVFNIGATMGERLFYHSSLGLMILAVMLGARLHERLQWTTTVKRIVLGLCLIPIGLLMGFKTIDRNRAWASDYTLFTTDVRTVPNSALTNNNAGTEIYNSAFGIYHALERPSLKSQAHYQSQLKSATVYFNKAIAIHDRYVVAYMNRGLCFFHSGNRAKAAEDWMMAASLYNGPHNFLKQNAKIFLDEGLTYGSKKEYSKALQPIILASKINPYDAFIWNNLGGSYFMTGQFKNASDAFAMALSMNPNLQDARNGKGAADAIFLLEEKIMLKTADAATLEALKKAYATCGVAKEFLKVKF